MSFSSPRRRFRPARRRSAASRRSPVRPFRSGQTLDGGRETDRSVSRPPRTGTSMIELATDHLTIIRWTTNNPGGSEVHYGIVDDGTDPKDVKSTVNKVITPTLAS